MDQRAQPLCQMLERLEKGAISAIEFGVPSDSYYRYFRIRVIGTPAGRQFAIKYLHNGMEGSGDYYPLDAKEEIKAEIWKRVAKTEMSNPNPGSRFYGQYLREMRERMPKLDFIAI